MLRHGNPFPPAPMCFFWAPLNRVTALLTAATIVNGDPAQAR
jgi:hypothetical protein